MSALLQDETSDSPFSTSSRESIVEMLAELVRLDVSPFATTPNNDRTSDAGKARQAGQTEDLPDAHATTVGSGTDEHHDHL